jgi:heme exporter protein CcmD
MILEFLNMGGYGLYIWLSYAFAALSLISLYYGSVKKLNSIKNIEHLYRSEKVKEVSVSVSASAQVSKF